MPAFLMLLISVAIGLSLKIYLEKKRNWTSDGFIPKANVISIVTTLIIFTGLSYAFL